MSIAEGITGLIASVCAIIATVVIAARWLDKRFDRWTNSVIENSRAIRALTARMDKLESRMN